MEDSVNENGKDIYTIQKENRIPQKNSIQARPT